MKVGVDVGEAGESPEGIETTTVGQLVAVFWGKVEPGVPRLHLPRLVAQVGESVKCVRAEEGVDVLNFEVGIVQPENEMRGGVNSLIKVSRKRLSSNGPVVGPRAHVAADDAVILAVGHGGQRCHGQEGQPNDLLRHPD